MTAPPHSSHDASRVRSLARARAWWAALAVVLATFPGLLAPAVAPAAIAKDLSSDSMAQRSARIALRDRSVAEAVGKYEAVEMHRLRVSVWQRDRGGPVVEWMDGDEVALRAYLGSTSPAAKVTKFEHLREPTPAKLGFDGSADYGGAWITSPWVFGSLLVAFLACCIGFTGLRSMLALDAIVLASFAVPHALLRYGHEKQSVLLVYLPLLYVVVRMLLLFIHEYTRDADERGSRRVGLLPTGALVAIAAVALAGRTWMHLATSTYSDVGLLSWSGARAMLRGEPIWGHLVFHGDTYGPFNYLIYVPATWIAGLFGVVDTSPYAVRATALAADLACVALLAIVAWRVASTRAAAFAAAAWLTYPETAFALQNNTNDALMVAFVLAAMAALHRPLVRGLLLGIAVGIKFAPVVALGPLLFRGTNEGSARYLRPVHEALRVTAGLALALVVGAGIVFAVGDASAFPDAVAFQARRTSNLSVWGRTGLEASRMIVAAACTAMFALMLAYPRSRAMVQCAAGVAAALAATQLVTIHWWYPYVTWFLAPMIIVIATATPSPKPRH